MRARPVILATPRRIDPAFLAGGRSPRPSTRAPRPSTSSMAQTSAPAGNGAADSLETYIAPLPRVGQDARPPLLHEDHQPVRPPRQRPRPRPDRGRRRRDATTSRSASSSRDDLFAGRDIVLFYDRSSGIHFGDKASQADFNRALSRLRHHLRHRVRARSSRRTRSASSPSSTTTSASASPTASGSPASSTTPRPSSRWPRRRATRPRTATRSSSSSAGATTRTSSAPTSRSSSSPRT